MGEYFVSSCVQVSLYILMFRFISILCLCFHDETHVNVMSCMWCMSLSNLGLRDCMLTSVILSPVDFQKILSDLSSGHNK